MTSILLPCDQYLPVVFYLHEGGHVFIHFCLFICLSINRITLSLSFNGHFSWWSWVSRNQNVSILDVIGAEVDGGCDDNWSYKACKAPVKSSPPTNHNPTGLLYWSNLYEILWNYWAEPNNQSIKFLTTLTQGQRHWRSKGQNRFLVNNCIQNCCR